MYSKHNWFPCRGLYLIPFIANMSISRTNKSNFAKYKPSRQPEQSILVSSHLIWWRALWHPHPSRYCTPSFDQNPNILNGTKYQQELHSQPFAIWSFRVWVSSPPRLWYQTFRSILLWHKYRSCTYLVLTQRECKYWGFYTKVFLGRKA